MYMHLKESLNEVEQMRKPENISAANISVVPETLQDAADIYQYMGCDPEITKYTGWNPYQSLQNTTEKIEQDIEY